MQILKREIRLETVTDWLRNGLKKLASNQLSSQVSNDLDNQLQDRGSSDLDNQLQNQVNSDPDNNQLQRPSTKYSGLRPRHQNRPRLHRKNRPQLRNKNSPRRNSELSDENI